MIAPLRKLQIAQDGTRQHTGRHSDITGNAMTDHAFDLPLLQQWVGRTEVKDDLIQPAMAAALAATLDRAAPAAELPPLWHWIYFWIVAPASEVGADGHPQRGGFLPPVPLPRRMWAGGRLTFTAPLAIGQAATRTSRILDVEAKAGASGRWPSSRCAMKSRRTGASPSPRSTTSSTATCRSPAPPRRPAQGRAGRRRLDAGNRARPGAAVSLFRADLQRPPHPLRPQLCHRRRRLSGPDRAWSADRHAAAGPAAPQYAMPWCEFSFRAVGPLFDIEPFTVCGQLFGADGRVKLWAKNRRGELAMQAEAVISPQSQHG
jgi:3-methylfumaryl-CoA hydratase